MSIITDVMGREWWWPRSEKKGVASLLSRVPPEVWARIFASFNRREVVNLRLVSKEFVIIAQSPAIWKWRLYVDLTYWETDNPNEKPFEPPLNDQIIRHMGVKSEKPFKQMHDELFYKHQRHEITFQEELETRNKLYDLYGAPVDPAKYLDLPALYEPLPSNVIREQSFFEFYRKTYTKLLQVYPKNKIEASVQGLIDTIVENPSDIASARQCYRLLNVWKKAFGILDMEVPPTAFEKYFQAIRESQRKVYSILKTKKRYVVVALLACGVTGFIARYAPAMVRYTADYLRRQYFLN